MSSQAVFYLNLGIGAALALLFLYRSRPKEPSRLKLWSRSSSTNASNASDTRAIQQSAQKSTAHRSQSPPSDYISPEAVEAFEKQAPIKSLNVIFNYNGHTWDAYEVLGLPAGTKWEQVEKAYAQALKKSQPQSHEFLREAYHAIRSRS